MPSYTPALRQTYFHFARQPATRGAFERNRHGRLCPFSNHNYFSFNPCLPAASDAVLAVPIATGGAGRTRCTGACPLRADGATATARVLSLSFSLALSLSRARARFPYHVPFGRAEVH
eukprot:6205947-Pleurochrysis_carterae.AAC.2